MDWRMTLIDLLTPAAVDFAAAGQRQEAGAAGACPARRAADRPAGARPVRVAAAARAARARPASATASPSRMAACRHRPAGRAVRPRRQADRFRRARRPAGRHHLRADRAGRRRRRPSQGAGPCRARAAQPGGARAGPRIPAIPPRSTPSSPNRPPRPPDRRRWNLFQPGLGLASPRGYDAATAPPAVPAERRALLPGALLHGLYSMSISSRSARIRRPTASSAREGVSRARSSATARC